MIVGRTAVFLCIVYEGYPLFAIYGKEGDTQIEDYSFERVGFQDYGRMQPIVKYFYFWKSKICRTKKESEQHGRVFLGG
jgi:hypothetical protein